MRTFVAVFLGLGIASPALGHGVVGQRFFPATLTIDDPFVADEMSLPTVEGKESRGHRRVAVDLTRPRSARSSKRLSRELGLSLGGAFLIQDQHDGPAVTGFDNLEVALKYQFLTAPEHEFLLSAGLEADVGGTGEERVGAERFSTIAPTFFFGKGMGDIPDSLSMLKPFALTGAFAIGFPTQEHTTTATVDEDGEVEEERELNPRTIEWGFSVQYSLQYLQSYVRDIGLPEPFNRMIPLVEFAMESTIQGPGKTAGTINPGGSGSDGTFNSARRPSSPSTATLSTRRRSRTSGSSCRSTSISTTLRPTSSRGHRSPASLGPRSPARLRRARAARTVARGMGARLSRSLRTLCRTHRRAVAAEVAISFDGAIEASFSTLRVEDAGGRQVDRGDAHVNSRDDTLLEVTVPPLPGGAYHAVWSVVARDGHRTEGSFPFTVDSP